MILQSPAATFEEQADKQQITKKICAKCLARTPSLQCGSSGNLGDHDDLRNAFAFGSRICSAISNDGRASKNDRMENDRLENLWIQLRRFPFRENIVTM